MAFDWQAFTAFIKEVGFPIAAYAALFVYMALTGKRQAEATNNMSKAILDMGNAVSGVCDALDNNNRIVADLATALNKFTSTA